MNWAYRMLCEEVHVDEAPEGLHERLNAEGKYGWELVSVSTSPANNGSFTLFIAWLKLPLSEAERQKLTTAKEAPSAVTEAQAG